MRKLLALLLVPVLLAALIYGYGSREASQEVETLLVFGSPPEADGSPSKLLKSRLDGALAYLEEHPGSQALLLGGGGAGVSEASVMASYLVSQGLSKDRLTLEESSTSTWTNLVEAKKIMEIKKIPDALACSSDYHQLRIALLSRRLGLKTYPLPVKTPASSLVYNYLRELMAIVKSFFLDY